MTDERSFILGVDLDGVCGDYTAAFREVVAHERGVDPSTLADERSWDFAEWGLTPDDFHDLHQAAVLDHHMFRTMPVVAGAADALWRLSDAGVWIRLITHRLYVNWGHAVVLEDTAAWLDTAAIPYRDICVLGQKPQVEADAYVDDAPHNIADLEGQGNTAIVFDQPYNQTTTGLRAHGWGDVEQIVRGLVAERGLAIQEQLPGLDPGAGRLRGHLNEGRGDGQGTEGSHPERQDPTT
jgi:5'(3')-deoxyribonucleotidase